jgi:diadenosine tetraphosphate (Ap4A) HIT family hydrolase
MPTPCLACEIVAGRHVPPGGLLARREGFLLHGVPGPTPVAGWVVLTPERHVRGTYDLTPEEAERLGRLAVEVQRAQREVLRAEHVYLVALGEVLLHAHVHLIPRYADTPAHLRGPRVFLASPAEMASAGEVEAATEALRRALRG